jgi:hypothetical protein
MESLMNGWIDECLIGWMDERMVRWMVEYMDECVDVWMLDGWMNGKVDGW